MEFKTNAQRACYEKVLPMVRSTFGEFAIVLDDRPGFAIPQGSTLCHIGVHPWGEDSATVLCRSYVVMGPELVPDLLMFLLRTNDDMRFGAFGVDRDGDIFFEHSIVGATIDKDELKASVMAVIWTADKYDDEIVGRWGGRRCSDRPPS